ncbi:hypothetical protein T439DRAFT_371838 [Meredithblackwellia eburnea MCA 4105]
MHNSNNYNSRITTVPCSSTATTQPDSNSNTLRLEIDALTNRANSWSRQKPIHGDTPGFILQESARFFRSHEIWLDSSNWEPAKLCAETLSKLAVTVAATYYAKHFARIALDISHRMVGSAAGESTRLANWSQNLEKDASWGTMKEHKHASKIDNYHSFVPSPSSPRYIPQPSGNSQHLRRHPATSFSYNHEHYPSQDPPPYSVNVPLSQPKQALTEPTPPANQKFLPRPPTSQPPSLSLGDVHQTRPVDRKRFYTTQELISLAPAGTKISTLPHFQPGREVQLRFGPHPRTCPSSSPSPLRLGDPQPPLPPPPPPPPAPPLLLFPPRGKNFLSLLQISAKKTSPPQPPQPPKPSPATLPPKPAVAVHRPRPRPPMKRHCTSSIASVIPGKEGKEEEEDDDNNSTVFSSRSGQSSRWRRNCAILHAIEHLGAPTLDLDHNHDVARGPLLVNPRVEDWFGSDIFEWLDGVERAKVDAGFVGRDRE